MKTDRHVNRRSVLFGAVGTAGAMILGPGFPAKGARVVTKGRIKQSIAFWCFNVGGDKWDMYHLKRELIDQQRELCRLTGNSGLMMDYPKKPY